MPKTKMDYLATDNIEPNNGIGPFVLGMSEKELFEIIPDNSLKCKIGENYTLKYGEITLWVNTESKRLTQVGVTSGFSGKLFGKVGIGSTVNDAELFLGKLVVDNEFQLTVEGVPGVSFHTQPVINDLNPIPERNSVIDGIYVFKEC